MQTYCTFQSLQVSDRNGRGDGRSVEKRPVQNEPQPNGLSQRKTAELHHRPAWGRGRTPHFTFCAGLFFFLLCLFILLIHGFTYKRKGESIVLPLPMEIEGKRRGRGKASEKARKPVRSSAVARQN